MNIAGYFVRNRAVTLILFLGLLALGLQAVFTIPRAEDPQLRFPGFTIVAVQPGASPVDVEQLVVNDIEKRLKELDRVKSIKTSVTDGLGVIGIEFTTGSDPERKYDEVVREMNALRPSLPPDLYALDVIKNNTGDVNIVQVALVSATATDAELERWSRRLKDRLATVPGVRKTDRVGEARRELQLSIDLGRLAALRLPVAQLLGAVASESANIPGGRVDVGTRQLVVKTSGSYTSLDDVRRTVITRGAGGVVRLGEVADVRWGKSDPTHLTRHDGRRAVFVVASMQDGQSIGEDFVIAILLVLVTLLPLGFRASAVVMVSIPLSLAAGTAALAALGFSLNQLTIVGFVIALGLLVDDSIVVVENIARFMREGYSRMEAAVAATRQITLAVLGTTATLVFAFVPLTMLPGGPGDFIRSLPAAVIATILASLVVSLTIIPWLASAWLPADADPHGNRVLRGLQRLIHVTYSRLLHVALAHPRRTLLTAAVLFVASLGLVPAIGFSLFPKAGIPQFRVTIDLADDATLGETDRVARSVEAELRRHPEVRDVMTNVGHGNPFVYYNVQPVNDRADYAELFARVDRFDPDRTPRLLDSLRARFDRHPSARIAVREYENGPPIDAPIAIRFIGPDLDSLRAIAGRFERMLVAIPGTRDVENPLATRTTNVRVAVDRAKAGVLGVPVSEVDRLVRLGLVGLEAGRIQDSDGESYPVVARLPRTGRATMTQLAQVHVPTASGAAVPLAQVAQLRLERSQTIIQHFGTERSVTVTAQVRTGFNTDRLTRAALDTLAAWQLPAGYRWVAAGEIESRQESFGGIGSAVVIAIFGITAILVLEFGSFRSTLIVASVIPLGVVGGLAALWLSGYTLSFTAVIGFDQELDPARRLYQPAAPRGAERGCGDRGGGARALSSHRAHVGHGDRRAAPARTAGVEPLQPAGGGAHRRTRLEHAPQSTRHPGDIQAPPPGARRRACSGADRVRISPDGDGIARLNVR
ncbi:MAG: efflux RND transporter permease subunit [Gemmatimonadaceae bacterium]|nr:efflux RND transporter permease subunit [Gemmatimonadaceae bacterium]